MARTTNQPVTATRRNPAKTRLEATTVDGPLDDQDQHREDVSPGDHEQRREGLTAVQDEQHDDRERNENRDERENADDRESADNREQRPAMAGGVDTFAPVLEAWKQVFKSWSELTETMVKVQQDTFASMISSASGQARDINLGENGRGERAFSASRNTIEPDHR